MKLGVSGKKNNKGERKKEENYIKKGEKALKMHLLGYKLKKIKEESFKLRKIWFLLKPIFVNFLIWL